VRIPFCGATSGKAPTAPKPAHSFVAPTKLAKDEKPRAEHDRDISHVEHSGTDRSYSHVQEVDDAARKTRSIQFEAPPATKRTSPSSAVPV
jgi:hypothetical protein